MDIAFLCIIIFIVIILLYKNNKKIPNAKKTVGSISFTENDKLDASKKKYCGYIKYFVQDKEYNIKIKNQKKYSNKTNKKVIIKYNSENPNQIVVINNWPNYLLTILLIISVLAIFYCIITNNVQNDKNKEECCTCLDCPQCDLCCDCDNPYINK